MFLNLLGFMQQRPKMAFWVSFTTFLATTLPRLKLPPLAVLELHEARHEGAAGKAVGPVQPPDPGHAKKGHELLAGRQGEAEALRRPRCAARTGPSHLHARGGSPVQVVVQFRGKVVVHEEQVAHPPRTSSSGSCSQLSLAAFSSGRTALQGPLGMGSVIAAGYKSKYKIQPTGSSEL